ncbi:MAG: TonB-dependent receptor [Rhodocyclaceae bacterium]|nr:MAG: TonB-dependent receptor [Rhodocyclaceae bacterium]
MPIPFKPLPLAVALLCASPAFAEEARTLGDVVVSASRSETKLEEMPLHTTVISREDIAKSPAQTLDQLLRNVPSMNFTGVPAAISDPTGHQTKMRGVGNAKVLVLLDGVPIHDPFYLTTQWYKVPLSNIDRVEIIRGGNSSLWGNMATAGVINIVSKHPRDNGGELTASFGTQGTTNFAASRNVVVSDALSLNFSADNYRTDGYQTIPAEYLWRNPGKGTPKANDSNVQVSAFYRPSADFSSYLRLGYHIQDQDLGYRVNNNLQESPDIAGGFTQRLGKDATLAANAWAQYVRFEKYNGSSCYLVAANDCRNSSSSTLTQANTSSPVVQFYSQYGSQRYREQGSSVQYSETLSGQWNSLQLGADVRRLTASDAEWFYSNPGALNAPQGKFNSSTYGEGVQLFQGLFAQAKYLPIAPLELTFSGRYDRWDNSSRVNTRTTAAGAATGGPQPDTNKSAFNPSIAARYDLTDQFALRGAAYKAFRAPGFNNTTRTYGSSTPTIANPDLGPENLTGLELGGDFSGGDLKLGATYFLYRIKNMIATFKVSSYATAPTLVRTICSNGGANLTNCGGSANFYTNDQDGESHGVELVGHWRASSTLALDAAYTATETFLTRRGAVVTDPLGVQLTAVPKQVATVSATWNPAERVQTYMEVRYIGPMMIDTTSNSSTLRARQGGNTVVNLSTSYRWDRDTDLFLSAVNLFDRAYSENSYTYNQPYNRTLSSPLALTAGVKFRF